jgi:hypothetical protein
MARLFGTELDMQQNPIIHFVLEVLASAPSSPATGRAYFDSGLNQIGVWDGAEWDYGLITVPAATGSVEGILKLTGDLGNTAASPEVVNLHLSGDTSIGHKLTNVSTPTNGSDAATKDYVDSAIFGLKPIAVDLATAGALPSYTGGGTGVLTGSSNGALSVDSTAVTVGMLVLVKNETSTAAEDNGVYVVTTVGTGSTKYVLTRATDVEGDAVTWTDLVGQLVAVSNEGATLGDTIWLSSVAPGGTLGSTAVNYVQIQSGLSIVGDGTYTTRSGSQIQLVLATTPAGPTAGTASAVAAGGAHVAKFTLKGDGSTTSFACTHNLGTSQVHVGAQTDSTGPSVPIELDWTPTSSNVVTVQFASAPGSGVLYYVTVVG